MQYIDHIIFTSMIQKVINIDKAEEAITFTQRTSIYGQKNYLDHGFNKHIILLLRLKYNP